MAEYISREAALEYIKSVQCKTCSDIGMCGGCAVLVAVRLLEKVPAADVTPVRHGRWKRYGKNLGECSECGEIVSVKNNYCPACGCLML